MLVSLNKGTAAMLVSQTNPQGIELYSYAKVFFCFGWKTCSLITWVKTLYSTKTAISDPVYLGCHVTVAPKTSVSSAPYWLRRKWRKTLTISFILPSTKGRWETLSWLSATLTQRLSDNRNWETSMGSDPWEWQNVPCIKWTCNQANTLPMQEISMAHMEISWQDLWEPGHVAIAEHGGAG